MFFDDISSENGLAWVPSTCALTFGDNAFPNTRGETRTAVELLPRSDVQDQYTLPPDGFVTSPQTRCPGPVHFAAGRFCAAPRDRAVDHGFCRLDIREP